MIDTIEITKMEYFNLLKDSEKLARLEGGGVDNWSYYSESIHSKELNDESWDEWEERTRQEVYGLKDKG